MNKDELKIKMLEYRDKYDVSMVFIDEKFYTPDVIDYAREIGYEKIMVQVKL